MSIISITGIDINMAIATKLFTLRGRPLPKTASTISIEDGILSPLEHSHETLIQTYGMRPILYAEAQTESVALIQEWSVAESNGPLLQRLG